MMHGRYQHTLGLLALITLGGCASINDHCYEKTQTVRAIKEYVKCGKPECSPYPHDYKCGWIDGFYEVATGGDCCPPAVAPARYYKPKQILKHCDNKRHAYYSGWQDGAARASQFPDTHYLRIYETCECPFPRCDKPCGEGACRPYGMPFVGTEDMIEVAPVLEPLPVKPVPEANLIPLAPAEIVTEEVTEETTEEIAAGAVVEEVNAGEGTPAKTIKEEETAEEVIAEDASAVQASDDQATATKVGDAKVGDAKVGAEEVGDAKVGDEEVGDEEVMDKEVMAEEVIDAEVPTEESGGEKAVPAVPTDLPLGAKPAKRGSISQLLVPSTGHFGGASVKQEADLATWDGLIETRSAGFVLLAQPNQNEPVTQKASSQKEAQRVGPVDIFEAAERTFKMLETETEPQPAR